MSNINKQALREAAEKATPGLWVEICGEVTTADYEVDGVTFLDHICNCEIIGTESQNAEFIATANPTTVLELLDELEAKDKRIAELEAESEERRQFILNGVEMGFIRLPDKDTRDPATATYERCLNGIQYMPCPKCNDTGMMDSGGTQPWGEPIEIECDCRLQDANTEELVADGIITRIEE